MTCKELQNGLLSGLASDSQDICSHLAACAQCTRFAALHTALQSRGEQAREVDLSVERQDQIRSEAASLLLSRSPLAQAAPAHVFASGFARVGLGLAAALLLIVLASRFQNRAQEGPGLAQQLEHKQAPEALLPPANVLAHVSAPAEVLEPSTAQDVYPPLPISWPRPQVETQIVASRAALNSEVRLFRKRYRSNAMPTFEHRSAQLTARIQRISSHLSAELEGVGKAAGPQQGRLRDTPSQNSFVMKKEDTYEPVAKYCADRFDDHVAYCRQSDPS